MHTVKAWWQSGYAEDCKSLDAGSIPTQASTIKIPHVGIFLFNIHNPSTRFTYSINISFLAGWAGLL